MEKDPTYYHTLITKYFAGELSGQELSLLSEWLKQNELNRIEFNNFQKTWEVIEKSKVDSIDNDTEWKMLKSKIDSSVIAKKEVKVIQLDTNKKDRKIFLKQAFRIAAVIIILAGFTFVILNFMKQSPTQKQLVAQYEKVEGKLPDGSTVTLNTGSSLDYPEEFTGSERLVSLKGEAFFEVASDKEKPFKISANDLIIEVVGTSFFVKADKDGYVEVIVKSGKVAVYPKDNPSEKKILEPGDKAEFSSQSKSISESKNSDENFISWKTDVITFNDDSLSEVVAALNRHYKAEITIADDKLKGEKLTGSYPNYSLEQILNLIASTYKIKVTKITDKQIELSGYDAK